MIGSTKRLGAVGQVTVLGLKAQGDRRSLASRLDELEDMNTQVRRKKGGKGASLMGLRASLRQTDVMDKLIDMFHKFDSDGSGSVDQREFANAIMAVVDGARRQDANDLFQEFDTDGGGTITYAEMRETMRVQDEKLLQGQRSLPELPREIARRKRDVLQLFKETENMTVGAEGTPMAPSSKFVDALRTIYPKDSKETTESIVNWIASLNETKAAIREARQREADNALIESIDADKSGTIDVNEFCGLAKVAGLSKMQMRQKFRDKDFGNAGVLSLAQMRQVLHELRLEDRARKERAAEGTQGGTNQAGAPRPAPSVLD